MASAVLASTSEAVAQILDACWYLSSATVRADQVHLADDMGRWMAKMTTKERYVVDENGTP